MTSDVLCRPDGAHAGAPSPALAATLPDSRRASRLVRRTRIPSTAAGLGRRSRRSRTPSVSSILDLSIEGGLLLPTVSSLRARLAPLCSQLRSHPPRGGCSETSSGQRPFDRCSDPVRPYEQTSGHRPHGRCLPGRRAIPSSSRIRARPTALPGLASVCLSAPLGGAEKVPVTDFCNQRTARAPVDRPIPEHRGLRRD